MAVHIRLLTAVVLSVSVVASPGVPLHNCSREYDVELGKDDQLEVCHKNELGGVCNEDGTFDETDARVVCYQLNRSGENATTKNCVNKLVPNKVWWTDVECLGTDENFESCEKKTISECSDFFYVCVTCPEESELRLMAPVGKHFERANIGRLQIYFNGTWSEICVKDGANWPQVNGQVICEELGLGGCKRPPTKDEEQFQYAKNWITSEEMMNCRGNESSIKDCKTTPWREVPPDPQTTYYYIYVECTGPEIRSPEVTPNSPHSVKVKWSIDQAVLLYPIVTEFQIQYTQRGMKKVINHPATDSTHYSVEVDGLKHNTEYSFTIQAIMMPFNDSGPSSTVTGKTASLPDSSGLEVGLAVGLGVGILLIIVIVSISCLAVARKCHKRARLGAVPGGGINTRYGALNASSQENSEEQPRDEDPSLEEHPGRQHRSLPGYISA